VTVYGFKNREDAEATLRLLDEVRREVESIVRQSPAAPPSTLLLEATSAIARPSNATTPGSGTAKLKWRDLQTGLIADRNPNGGPDLSLTVYSMSVSIPNGELFEATYHRGGGLWVSKRLSATVYRGEATADFDSGDSTYTIDTLKAYNGYKAETSTITVDNTDDWEGSNNDIIWVMWNDENGQWEHFNIGCDT